MSSVVISGDTSGAITLSAPAVAGTNTITLPASTGTVLTTGSPQSGGVLQVKNTYTGGGSSTTSGSYVTTSISVSITPKFATSKIYLNATSQITNTSNGGAGVAITIFRNGSVDLATGDGLSYYQNNGINTYNWVPAAMSALDSPATASAITYTIYIKTSVSGTAYITNGTTSITAMEIAA
jgi:hypothetical protein